MTTNEPSVWDMAVNAAAVAIAWVAIKISRLDHMTDAHLTTRQMEQT